MLKQFSKTVATKFSINLPCLNIIPAILAGVGLIIIPLTIVYYDTQRFRQEN